MGIGRYKNLYLMQNTPDPLTINFRFRCRMWCLLLEVADTGPFFPGTGTIFLNIKTAVLPCPVRPGTLPFHNIFLNLYLYCIPIILFSLMTIGFHME